MPARLTIGRDRLVTESWNRPIYPGPIDPANPKSDPENPLTASFLVNVGLADTRGASEAPTRATSRL